MSVYQGLTKVSGGGGKVNTVNNISPDNNKNVQTVIECESLEEYEAIENKDPNIVYLVKDGEVLNPIIPLDDTENTDSNVWSAKKCNDTFVEENINDALADCNITTTAQTKTVFYRVSSSTANLPTIPGISGTDCRGLLEDTGITTAVRLQKLHIWCYGTDNIAISSDFHRTSYWDGTQWVYSGWEQNASVSTLNSALVARSKTYNGTIPSLVISTTIDGGYRSNSINTSIAYDSNYNYFIEVVGTLAFVEAMDNVSSSASLNKLSIVFKSTVSLSLTDVNYIVFAIHK